MRESTFREPIVGRDSGRQTLMADAIVQEDSAVLLVRLQDSPDGLDGWRLPGAQLRYGEHPEACARRVLKEALGLQPEWLALAEVESIPGEHWQMIFHYRCDADRLPAADAGILESKFFQLEHLPPTAHGAWEREVIYRVIISD